MASTRMPALAEQAAIGTRIVRGDLLGCMREIELPWPTTTRLEVDEQQPVLRGEHVARVRLAVQQLLVPAVDDSRPSVAACRRAAPRSASASAGVRSRLATSPRAESTRSVKCGVATSSVRIPACSRASASA